MPARLCLIPARGGSKAVPGKNLALVNGETLTRRAARCAVMSGIFDRIVVSTDDHDIMDEAVAGGAEAPFLRPAELASDTAPVLTAVQHAVNTLRATGFDPDSVTLLEPTSPMRTPEIVRTVIGSMERADADSATTLSLVPDNYRPVKQMYLGGDGLTEDVAPLPDNIYRRQDLPPSYIRNGMVYAMTKFCVMELGRVIGPRNVGVVIEGAFVNIDWPGDLERARQLLEKHDPMHAGFGAA